MRRVGQREQSILEQEPEVAGDLIVPGAAGVEPLAQSGQAPGEPILDRRMHILVGRAEPEPALLHGDQRPAESASEPGVLARAQEAGGAESLHVAQAAEHVPAQQPGVPGSVLAGGGLEKPLVRRCPGAPQRGGGGHAQSPPR